MSLLNIYAYKILLTSNFILFYNTFYIFCRLFEKGLFCLSISKQRFRFMGSDWHSNNRGHEWFQHPAFTFQALGTGAHQLSQFKHRADVQPVLKANAYLFKKIRGSLRTWLIFSSKQFPWPWHLIELHYKTNFFFFWFPSPHALKSLRINRSHLKWLTCDGIF